MNSTSSIILTDDALGDATMLPEYWGWWFYPIDGGNMQRVYLPTFYQFGRATERLNQLILAREQSMLDVLLASSRAVRWLRSFVKATNDITFTHSREAAESIIDFLINNMEVVKPQIDAAGQDGIHKPTSPDATFLAGLKKLLEEFELLFARESRKASVFTVTPKGIYDTEKLIEAAEKRFPENLLKVMPHLTIADIKEAGRCLAFDLPTACAFHVCRATEALMLAYYEALTNSAWAFPRRDWYNYNTQLASNGAPAAITNRLGEIREDRNAYAHPDVTVSLDEAPVVFELCSGVIFLMAKEIEKIEAAKAAAANPPTSSPT